MSGSLHSVVRVLFASVVALVLTIGAYLLGIALQKRWQNPLANPVLFAIIVVGGLLKLTHISYDAYFSAAQPIHLLLGPATVALAVPLVRSLKEIRKTLLPVCAALIAGCLINAVSGYAIARALGASQAVSLSMLPKGATTPIAIGVGQAIGGSPALTAVFAIMAGILVAVFIDGTLGWLRISDWRAVGLAASTAGSGIGASRVIPQHPIAAAFAGIGLGANGLLTAVLSPFLAAVLKQW